MRYRFMRFPDGKPKALTLSYDDGCSHDKKLIEIADKYGIKVTLNINSALMAKTDGEWRLTANAIKEITKSGNHEIATHGAQHIAPAKASLVDGIKDTLDCRQMLEKEFGGIIRGMAYPDSGITKSTNGLDKAEIKNYLKALGIAYARTSGGDNDSFDVPNDFYEWMPTAHHTNPKLMQYLNEFLNYKMPEYVAVHQPKLFYLWGHSYEFNDNSNWEILIEFCEKASGKADIWYATNIEICDYVNAYRQLQFNVDNTLVYNPTCKTVWFEADGVTISVKPNETKAI